MFATTNAIPFINIAALYLVLSNIHAANLEMSRYVSKMLTVRQYDTSKSAVFVSFLCLNPNPHWLG